MKFSSLKTISLWNARIWNARAWYARAWYVSRQPVRTAVNAGFTLLEMLVVLVIIGLLAGLVGPQLMSRVDTSKVTTADTQVRMLKSALDTMRLDIGRYPTKEEGLAMLTTPPQDERAARKWQGPYLSEGLPLDPWGNAYQYNPLSTNNILLYSFGADGQPGGEGINADVGFIPKTTDAAK